MVKADIIRSIELKLDLSHEEASLQVEQILSIIKDHLEGGEPMLVSGFGQWKVREKKSRIGRNPKTREEFEVSPRRVVTFLFLECLAGRNLQQLWPEIGGGVPDTAGGSISAASIPSPSDRSLTRWNQPLSGLPNPKCAPQESVRP